MQSGVAGWPPVTCQARCPVSFQSLDAPENEVLISRISGPYRRVQWPCTL